MTAPSSKDSSRNLTFRIAAFAVFCTGIYHSVCSFHPALERAVYGAAWRFPGIPPQRHLAWAAIDVVGAGLLLWRPKWLLIPYIAIGVRLFNGHGRNIWRLWTESGGIAWAELGLLIGYTVIGVLLIMDLRERSPQRSPRIRQETP